MANSRHVPIYAAMAHPMIYYAQVQQPQYRGQNNNPPRKDNPFKKAFKWYTQERGRMLSNKPEVCAERSGFANWLDDKYDQYLREGGQPTPTKPAYTRTAPPTVQESRSQRNSIDEPEQCPGASRRYGRLKNQWNKRRGSVNDGGDVPEKGPCGSCEYILKPKELTRATSEHTPTSGGKSNATVASLNMCSGRSRSLSDVGREKSVPRHGDTYTHLGHGSRAHEQEIQAPVNTQVPANVQEKVTCKCPRCLCPPDEVPKEPEMPPRKQAEPCCPCSLKKTKPPPKTNQITKTNPPVLAREKSLDIKKQDSTRLPYCPCPQDKVPPVQKVPSKPQEPTYNQVQVQKKPSQMEKVPPKAQDQKNQPIPQQRSVSEMKEPEPSCKCPRCVCPPEEKPSTKQVQPCCQCPDETLRVETPPSKTPRVETPPSKTPQVEPPSKTKLATKVNLPALPQKKSSEIMKQNSTRLPCCPCPQEKVSPVEKLPSKTQEPTYPAYPVQAQKIPSQTENVRSRTQEPTYPAYPVQVQKKLPEIEKVPSKAQNPSDQPGPCCKCNLKKVPEIVQVPSQSRAVQESCQVPEDKVVPVSEGTQYESALRSPRSTQQMNVRPCCCNSCNPLLPPPSPIFCLPVKVQSSKISGPETYLITPSAIDDAPKKQKKTTQRRSVSCQFDEGNKSKVNTQSEQQKELCVCSKPCICSKPCSTHCHSVNQVSDQIAVRRLSHSTVAISEDTGAPASLVRELAVVNKSTRSVTRASNDAAQTSDHSICFDKDAVGSCQCPLFLKIIYADMKE
ncbi:hypothetical protein PYW07_014414 [Mythimna separata]|uniref:Uncharacterized protein n=1 Tax=Mythimna separata TaxID=271217 RepID=A0AAD7YZW8_MYTSE|nr:hypothetical protein PYW07_014414 [Mythimna separata]